MRILFFGTPPYTVDYLDLLVKEHTICALVTAPDRAAGRGLQVKRPRPAHWAEAHDCLLLQPTNLKDEALVARVGELQADVGVVVAYGKLIPRTVFSLPRFGCLNLHFSLLPRFRGASPVEHCLLSGDSVSGVSLQRITEELDAGDILVQQEVLVQSSDHYPDLFARLHQAGQELLLQGLSLLASGQVSFKPQAQEGVVHCRKITTGERVLDWRNSAAQVVNHIRAFSGLRTAYGWLQGKRVFVHRAQLTAQQTGGKPGEIIQADRAALSVACGEGAASLLKLQQENRRAMEFGDFINGNRITPGMQFELKE